METNTKPIKLAAMQSLISRLSGRKDEDIPSAKGVCIPNGFIRDNGEKHKESLTFRYENDDFFLVSIWITQLRVRKTPCLTVVRKLMRHLKHPISTA